MDVENFVHNPLWRVLVETVHSIILYPHHKAYVREHVLPRNPDVSPLNLAVQLDISEGEAMVILHELKAREDAKK